ncbi:MAG TPA: MlaD family protein [Solirubrobacteraceae bacterium]|jgi:virulence factor Mce-like protein|nr:MlaD family protein [Solirubrobacteraceae bacterium]
MNRRRSNSLAGSPLLIGAVTTLIVVVAVFLSYNANNGLPFTPTYDIKVQLPEASGLQKGNQVRIGGERVGVISSLSPYQDPATGRVTAIVSLKLEKAVEPLPASTTAIVQSVSTIGLKYLALEKGRGGRTLKAGETIPVSQTREPVDIDQFFDMFDKKTRIANQVNLTSFGNGFAGRGIGLNETISTLRPLVTNAIPVLHNLASPQTGFGQLFVALDRTAKEVAPVASEQADFYSNLDTFFTAFASVAPSLEQAIVGGPPALRQATHSLPFEASFVNKSAEFMSLLRPSASLLRTVAAPLGHAFEVGAVNVRAATALNPELAEASEAFAAFAKNPIVTGGIEDLTHTLGLGNPLFAGLAPAQTNCNYVSLAFRNIASVLSESVGVGTLGRAAAVLAPQGPNNEGFPSAVPANGPSVDHTSTAGGIAPKAINDNHLHVNPYPNVGGPGQPLECEAGNEPYLAEGQAVIGNVPGNVGTKHETTTREQDLYGEPYTAQTLEALGLKSSKGAKK